MCCSLCRLLERLGDLLNPDTRSTSVSTDLAACAVLQLVQISKTSRRLARPEPALSGRALPRCRRILQLVQCCSLCRPLQRLGDLLDPNPRSLDVHYLGAVGSCSLWSTAACADLYNISGTCATRTHALLTCTNSVPSNPAACEGLTGRNAIYDALRSRGSYAAKNINPCK